MPNTREKLIELLRDVQYQGNAVHGYSDKYIQNGELADHLIANGVTVQKWIPVSERLPGTKDCIIVATTDGNVGEAFLYWDGVFHWIWDEYFEHELRVTHWMPLPEPPKGE